MRRIVFSLYNNISIPHQSVPQSKKDAFHEFYDRLVETQKQYAYDCGADYIHYTPSIPDYDDIQFEKLYRFEELTEEYDEVVYLDLDVVPTTKENIFDRHASHAGVGVHFIEAKPYWGERIDGQWWVDVFNLDKMNRIVKMCCKDAMLMLEGKYMTGHNAIANTGVLIGNKNSIQDFRLTERIDFADKVFNEALWDNIYPEQIASKFAKNNEVYFSFIKEYFDITINPIGLGWNYIIDETFTTTQIGAHLHHVVNKDFAKFDSSLLQSQACVGTLP